MSHVELCGLPDQITTEHKFLIVDSESAANVAKLKFKTYTVLYPSVPFSLEQLKFEHWMVLNGCEVVCWPTNAPLMNAAMVAVANTLTHFTDRVRLVHVNGVDEIGINAGFMAEWTDVDVRAWVKSRVRPFQYVEPNPRSAYAESLEKGSTFHQSTGYPHAFSLLNVRSRSQSLARQDPAAAELLLELSRQISTDEQEATFSAFLSTEAEGERALLRQRLQAQGITEPDALQRLWDRSGRQHSDASPGLQRPSGGDLDVQILPSGNAPSVTREENRKANFDPPVEPKQIAIRNMSALLTSKAEGREWLFEQILPIGAFLIVGRPKVGKSWLLLQLAIAAATCRDFLGFQALGAFGVLYIGAEDDDTRMKARFLRFGIDAPENLYVVLRNDLEALIEAHAAKQTFESWLDGYLEQNPHIKLVILDTESTIRNMWNGEHRGAGHDVKSITRKDYAEVREMDRIALTRSVFIGLVNHTAKRKGVWFDIHELINRTNTAMAGASGSIVIADPPDHDPMDTESRHRVLGIRGRDINEEFLMALEHLKSGAFESLGKWSLFTQTQAEQEIWDAAIEITEDMDCERFISARDIAEELGKKHQAVKRAISRMVKNNSNLVYKGYRMEVKKGEGLRISKVM